MANVAYTLASVENAESVINTPSEQTSSINQTESVLNFLDTGGDGHFGSDNAFPGMTVGEGLSNYVVQATGTLTITASQAGYYTFGVNSDDGFLPDHHRRQFFQRRGRHDVQRQHRWTMTADAVQPTPWARLTWPRAAIRSAWSISRAGAVRAWSSMPPRRAVPRE